MRAIVRWISVGSIERVTPSRRALWHCTQFWLKIWRICSGRSEATSRLLAMSGGRLAMRCCTSRTRAIRAMVRMRLTSTTSMTTMRKPELRGGPSVAMSRDAPRAAQCAGRHDGAPRARRRARQLFVDRQDASQHAEHEYSPGRDTQRDADLAE